MNTRLRLSRLVSVFSRGFVPVLVLCGAGSLWSVPATAETPAVSSDQDVVLVPIVGAAKEKLLRAIQGKGDQGLGTLHHECPAGTPHVQGITCGQTVSDSLTQAGSCPLNDNSYVDFYGFNGTAGQQVTIDLTAAFDTYLFLLDPSATVVDDDDDGGGGTNSRIVFTLTSSGSWFIAVNSFAANTFGAYTLTLVCSGGGGGGGGGGCTPNATTLCLNNGRFRVTSTFATNAGQSGNGMAVSETTDTGMFWFFSANNIEVIIKVVNACALSRYWVFAGGLTNVAVTITVTDTANGTVRTYSNPQGVAFQPVQDTNAFATCP